MACISEGEVPASAIPYQLTGSEDDAGVASRLAKTLIAWIPKDAGKLEVIRPGTFTAQYIRSTGLKTPVLIKGDRFNESPQLGLMWPDVDSITVDILLHFIGGDRKVDTWDVMRQRPGPAWTLSQWSAYWHARQDAERRQARPATAHGAPAMFTNDEDDEEGEVVDSGVVIVLQGVQGAPHSRYNPAPACVGISPEQTQRLLDGECLPLHGSALCQKIHPPPAIQAVDLARLVSMDLPKRPQAKKEKREGGPAKSDAVGVGAGETSRDGGSSLHGHKKEEAEKWVVPDIKTTDTLHLQMTPKDCFTDFRMAPGGAATWLYVLQGIKVVALMPPTTHNRRLFLTWATATRANQPKENVVVECFLPDYAEGAIRVQVKASHALVIPAGWFYCSAAPADTVAVGCYFWHPYSLADSARVQQMELQLKLKPQRFSLPARMLLFYAGMAYANRLRKELGMPEFKFAKVTESAGNARPSVSEASLNQQRRASPFMRGMAGPAGSEQQQRRRLVRGAGGSATPGSTPPMLGLQDTPGQKLLLECNSTMDAPGSARSKRVRQSDAMEHLYLGESAVPVAAAAADVQQQQQPLKRVKLVSSKLSPPLMAGAAGMTASTVSTPRSASRLQNHMEPAAAVAAVPSSSNLSGRLFHDALGLPGQQLRQQQQLQTPRGGRNRYAIIDDDDEGECHTSPVRKPEPGPQDDVAAAAAAAGIDWGGGYAAAVQEAADHVSRQQPRGEAPRAITALKIRVPGRAQPMYSPVIQPLKGDLDSIPALPDLQQHAAALASTAGGSTKVAERTCALLPSAATAAVMAGGATPGKKKLTLKGQATPLGTAGGVTWPSNSPAPGSAAATTAQQQQKATQVPRKPSPEQDSSAGSHALSAVEATDGADNINGQKQQQPTAVAVASQQRKVVLMAQGHDEEDAQQPVQQQQQQQQPPVAQPQPSMPSQLPPTAAVTNGQQRRLSDSGPSRLAAAAATAMTPRAAAAAAAGGSKPPLKLKFKLSSPSPRLAVLPTPQSESAVPPVLSLDGQSAGVPQQQQQQQQQQQGRVVPQVDGSGDIFDVIAGDGMLADVETAVQQGQHAMQQLLLKQQSQHQQQACLWTRWQQMQHSVCRTKQEQQQSQCQPSYTLPSAEWACTQLIQQTDGAGDEGRPAAMGPLLVLQPTATAATHVGQVSAAGGAASLSPVKAISPVKAQQHLHQQNGQHALPLALHQAELQPQCHNSHVHSPNMHQRAAGDLHHVQHQGLVIQKNPVLQSQVQKLRQASAVKSGADSGSPRDTAAGDGRGSQQQQQGGTAADAVDQQAVVAGASREPDGLAHDPNSPKMLLRDVPSFTCWAVADPPQAVADAAIAAAGAAHAGPVVRISESGRQPSVGVIGENIVAPAARDSPAMAGVREKSSTAAVSAKRATMAPSAVRPAQQQQQQQGMLPPPPPKLSSWELSELPMLVELLHEQTVEKLCDIPLGLQDPEYVVQQLHEAVTEARLRDEQERNARSAGISQQQPQQVIVGNEWVDQQLQAGRGPLFVTPFAPEEMPAGLLEHCRAGQQLLRASGVVAGLCGDVAGQHEATTEVVEEHDPSVAGGSIDNRSAGSMGGSRGLVVGGGQGAAGAAGVGVGRGARLGDVVAGRHQQMKRTSGASNLPVGMQQAKNIKKQQLLKGIGIKR